MFECSHEILWNFNSISFQIISLIAGDKKVHEKVIGLDI